MAADKDLESSSPTEKGHIPETTRTAGHQDGAVRSDNFLTRNGLNLDSFKKRDYGHGIVELDRSMKPRHLQMIAIGGSIGAGFFVGSGSALSTGGPGSLLIDFLIVGYVAIGFHTSRVCVRAGAPAVTLTSLSGS